MYQVVLKNLKTGERLVIDELTTLKLAEERRKGWRRALGGSKAWHVDRRPGLDTIDHLGLKVEQASASDPATDVQRQVTRRD